MTAQTSRYKLTYPTGSDLVSGAPAQFKSMADSVEKALGEVDDRQTLNAVKPVVRTTLAQLKTASAVTGQSGYVTGDGANNGLYVWSGSQWARVAMLDLMPSTSVKVFDNGTYTVVAHKLLGWCQLEIHADKWPSDSAFQTTLGTLPSGYRPHGYAVDYSMGGVNGGTQRRFWIGTDGVIHYANQGGTQSTGVRTYTLPPFPTI